MAASDPAGSSHLALAFASLPAMGSVAHRIGVLVELFMGAVFSDGKCDNRERDYVRALVADLLCKPLLPPEVEILIDRFEPEKFELSRVAADFLSDPPMNK